jgi:hypothetical protein
MLRVAKMRHPRAWLLIRRLSTSALLEPEPLTMRLPTVCVWGANTGVGKTLFSAGLGAACERGKVSGCSCAGLAPLKVRAPPEKELGMR